ncbi:hypothetical protein Gohar_008636, partial [Gossypium harknessii]|nr:hypothetical protein [Gossypium harknessii]
VDRNNRVHKKERKSGKEIGRFVHSYISELNEIGKNRPQTSIPVKKWKKPSDRVVKINFDAAYEGRQNKAAVGIVARDREGTVLLCCSEVHQRVSLAFAVEALACRKALQIGVYMQFEYIPRLANSLAHILATEALKSNKGDYLVGSVPEVAEKQAENERVREPD